MPHYAMKYAPLALLIAALAACSPPATEKAKEKETEKARTPRSSPSFFNGSELHARLADWKRNPSKDVVAAGVGYGFVIGVADAIHGYKEPRTGFCYSRPDKVTTTELVEVVYTYIRERPQSANLSAWSIVAAALANAYPCQ